MDYEITAEVYKFLNTWCAAIHGVAKSWARLSDWTDLNSTFLHIAIIHSFSLLYKYFPLTILHYLINCGKCCTILWKKMHRFWIRCLYAKVSLGIFLGMVLLSAKKFECLNFQFSSVAQSYPTLCDPMNRSMPGLPVHHQPLEFTETHVHQVI